MRWILTFFTYGASDHLSKNDVCYVFTILDSFKLHRGFELYIEKEFNVKQINIVMLLLLWWKKIVLIHTLFWFWWKHNFKTIARCITFHLLCKEINERFKKSNISAWCIALGSVYFSSFQSKWIMWSRFFQVKKNFPTFHLNQVICQSKINLKSSFRRMFVIAKWKQKNRRIKDSSMHKITSADRL